MIAAWAGAQVEPTYETKQVTYTYEVKSVHGLNSEMADFSPVVYGDHLVFTSSREFDVNHYGENRWSKGAYSNIFAAEIKEFANDSVGFGNAALYSYKFHADDHSGPICFTMDGNTAYFTQTPDRSAKVNGEKVVNKPQLYKVSKNDKGNWGKPEVLEFCNVLFSYGHPTVSADGNRLYFASDMDGGFGGKDIYMVQRNGDSWGEPKNLGEAVNSSGDEMFPSMNGDDFYFASNGFPGEGGLDLFRVYGTLAAIDSVTNLGNTINSSADDFGIVFNINGESGYFSSNRENGKGDDDIYYFKQIENVTVQYQTIEGQFTFRTLDNEHPDGLQVMLIEDGEVVFQTTTDEEGFFKFENLPMDAHYIIKAYGEDMELKIFTVNGEEILLLSNRNGEFLYRRLNTDVTVLSLIDERDMDLEAGTIDFSGQFVYEKLPGVYPQGLEVQLIDDEGNVVYTTTTDEYGNFTFESLPTDKDYMVKVINADGDIALLVYNARGEVVSELRMGADGKFDYRMLSSDYLNDLSLLDATDSDLVYAGATTTIFGKFDYTDLPGEPSGVIIHVTSDKGEVLYTTISDEHGYFRFTELPLTENVLFKIDEDDPNADFDMTMKIFDRYGNVIAVLVKDENGFFVYKTLDTDGSTIAIVNTTDIDLDLSMMNDQVSSIYFDFGSSELLSASFNSLDVIVDIMKANDGVKLRIESHTDSRSSAGFNMELSKKRSQAVVDYLAKRGISRDRLEAVGYGETKLLNHCKDGVDCTEEEHAANRRSDFVFVD